MLAIAPGHPDRLEPLLQRLVDVFARDGADVVLGPEQENLIRPRRRDDPGELPWIVEAEGLPNLLHEFLHYLQAGGLAVDHGIDYALIPFDTSRPEQRLLLWQELACCTISCAYISGHPARVQPWFNEQAGILHHFYGYDGAEPFFAHVDGLFARYREESEAVLAVAYNLAQARLGPPPERVGLGALWKAMQAR